MGKNLYTMDQKLNRLSEKKKKEPLFGKLNFEGDGDCLFHCISYALSSDMKVYYDAYDIRKITSEAIDENNFEEIISTYRILKDSNDFEEYWNPYEINNIDELKNLIVSGGHDYWGDHILLQLLMKQFNLNIFILETNTDEKIYSPYYFSDYNKDNEIILSIQTDVIFN